MNRHLVSGLVLFGITAAYYAAFGHRRFAAIARHQESLATAYARAERVSAEVAGIADLELAAAELLRCAEQLRPAVQRDPAQPMLLLAAQNTLKQGGLLIERVENLTAEAGIGLPNARIRATVSGSMLQLFHTLIELENAFPPTRVTDLTWQRQSAGANFRAELTLVQVWQETP
jgi:hypothetical protein